MKHFDSTKDKCIHMFKAFAILTNIMLKHCQDFTFEELICKHLHDPIDYGWDVNYQYRFTNSLILAFNYAFVIISHFLATLKLLNLKAFFFSMLTSTFAFNKTSQYFIFAFSLLVIVLRLFHCEINILVFVIGLSINVPQL